MGRLRTLNCGAVFNGGVSCAVHLDFPERLLL